MKTKTYLSKLRTLLFLIVVFPLTMNAQFGPCANNNDDPPPAGPPLAAENTMIIDGTMFTNGSDLCLGNMNPPEPQTIDGQNTLLLYAAQEWDPFLLLM